MGIRGLKILVVDDNAINRAIVREYLNSWGCFPEEAPGGEIALAKLQEAIDAHSPFNIAILDMMMPDMDGATLGRKIKADPKLSETLLVLLTSRGNRGEAREMQEIGFAAYLTKPIKGSQLRDCLTLVASKRIIEPETRPIPLVTRHSVAEQKKGQIRILLAEDNIINQKVALRHLERIGYRADVATNGKEVLEALERIPYDLIFMDVQMPEMDGFEATAAIRRKEREKGGHIPIIAMTAHAMKGDRERCLEAGMDDYLSKPIQPQGLIDAIARWLDNEALGKSKVSSLDPAEPKKVYDHERVMQRVDGDKAFFAEILGMFLEDAPIKIEKIREHLKEGDLAGLELQAHSLKGAASYFGAGVLEKVAFEIELAARDRELDRARTLSESIQQEFVRFKKALDDSEVLESR
jgi:two-component system, sensor histidine kinase and response regulator